MNTHILSDRSDLSLTSVMHALEKLNAMEADQRKKAVDFVELQFPPDLQSMTVAEHVAVKLLKMGVGIRLTCHWAFQGTRSWALQTHLTRVVNEGT